MTTWTVDGKDERLDPADRGLGYGDGVFETMAAADGEIALFGRHMARLQDGCRRLGFTAPDRNAIAGEIAARLPREGRRVVKLVVTRGSGARGYRPPAHPRPTRLLGVLPWPDYPASRYTDGVVLRTCALRLGENPALAGLKHLARLENVLAQLELAELAADEGVLLDTAGRVVGGTMSNLFAVHGRELVTPALGRCGVRGVMREVVLEAAPRIGLEPRETDLESAALHGANEIFVTNAVFGIWPAKAYDGTLLEPGPRTQQLQSMLGILDA